LIFHPNLYWLCVFPSPATEQVDTVFFSSSRYKAPTASGYIIQYFFIVTLYFLVLRSLGQSYCLKQLDTEDKVNLVLRNIGNYRPNALRLMSLALISLSSWSQIPSVHVIPLVQWTGELPAFESRSVATLTVTTAVLFEFSLLVKIRQYLFVYYKLRQIGRFYICVSIPLCYIKFRSYNTVQHNTLNVNTL
jgi:hypothetical protein